MEEEQLRAAEDVTVEFREEDDDVLEEFSDITLAVSEEYEGEIRTSVVVSAGVALIREAEVLRKQLTAWREWLIAHRIAYIAGYYNISDRRITDAISRDERKAFEKKAAECAREHDLLVSWLVEHASKS